MICRLCRKHPIPLSGRRDTCHVCYTLARLRRAEVMKIERTFQREQGRQKAIRRAA